MAEHYYAVGGASPINAQCRELLANVRAAGLDLPMYWGNRNWRPFLEDTVREMADAGVERAIAFVTSAYSSYSACRQYYDDIDQAIAAVGPRAPRIDKIRPYFNHPGFIEPFAASVADALATLPAGAQGGRAGRSAADLHRPQRPVRDGRRQRQPDGGNGRPWRCRRPLRRRAR